MKKVFTIILVCLLSVPVAFPQADNNLTAAEKKKGWILLFDGTSTNGWTTTRNLPVPAKGGGWVVENGCINTVLEGKGADIITKDEYSDFDLKVDFKITPGCNSGIKYLFTQYEPGGLLGCEYQVLDDKLAEDNKLATHLCGAFYDVLPPDESKKKINPPGEWNSARIVVKGKSVSHYLNNVLILKYTRGDAAYMAGVSKSKFSKAVPTFGMVEKGHVLLQYHGGLVSFKNIKIRNL